MEWYESPATWGIGLGATALSNFGTNLFNYGLQSEAFDYQKDLNERIMQREDTAIQRRMADARAAGVNPYAVVGQGAGAGGSVSAPSAPQMKNGVIDAIATGLDAYSRIAQTKKAMAEMENVQKEGMILDADLQGKLDTNKILGLDVANKIIDTQKNIAGFNYDYDVDYYLDDNNVLGNLGIGKYGKYFTKGYLENTPFMKMMLSKLSKAESEAKLAGANYTAREKENEKLSDILQEELQYKIYQNTYFGTDYDLKYISNLLDAYRLKNEQNKTLFAGYGVLGDSYLKILDAERKSKENSWFDMDKIIDTLKDSKQIISGGKEAYTGSIQLLNFLLSMLQ